MVIREAILKVKCEFYGKTMQNLATVEKLPKSSQNFRQKASQYENVKFFKISQISDELSMSKVLPKVIFWTPRVIV